MSNPPMYENLVPVDRVQHKNTRMKIGAPVLDRVTKLNSLLFTYLDYAAIGERL